MRLREEGVRAWHELCKVRTKVDVDIVLILVLKIDGFRHHLQAHKHTGEKHPLWVIEHCPCAVKERIPTGGRRNEDIGIEKRANQCLDSGVFYCLTWVDTESVARQDDNLSLWRPLDRPSPVVHGRVHSGVDAPHRLANAMVPSRGHD